MRIRSLLLAGVAGAATLLVAVANAAGYRFGVSDQEFYLPAVYLALDPTLFPHDRAMIEAQGPFLAFDDLMAALTDETGIGLPVLFLAMYVVALIALFGGAWLVGVRLYASRWTAAALVAALTLRHQIPGTGVNTFEGYLHPRALAFGIGLVALALFLRRHRAAALLVVVVAALMHPTTGAWFGIWLTVATVAGQRPSRGGAAALAAAAALGATLLAWLALERGIAPMDAAWTAVATRSYLSFHAWPAWTWAAHLGVIALAAFVYRQRAAAGLVDVQERAAFIGALGLLACLLLAVPFAEARIPLAVQLQPGRLFWIWDFLATVYLVWLLAESRGARSVARARVVCVAIVLLACARGAYIMEWEFPERPLVRMHLPGGDWSRVMAWAASTPAGSHFLADPAHVWRYGVSLRIAARRDVFLESSKDPALATYSRETARRVATRLRDLNDFGALDTARARMLAERYDLDYLIDERPFDLPLVREFSTFKVYRLPDQ